jgi:hypothetical protein
LHGTQAEDFWTAYDPDVADAPEDLPRVGNDHEALTNAKLSPTGYYTGFFHKDYQGNYVQKGRRTIMKKQHHHHHRPNKRYVQFNHDQDADDFLSDKELRSVERMNNEYVQFNHDKDEDDFLSDHELRSVEKMNNDYVQFNHDQDTEDIDVDMPETQLSEMRGSARQRIAEDENWTKFF